jgi:hypothetical protein
MLEGSANHCEYIHSPWIVQLLHFSNALGLTGIKQVLCQSWILFKKAKKDIKYHLLMAARQIATEAGYVKCLSAL